MSLGTPVDQRFGLGAIDQLSEMEAAGFEVVVEGGTDNVSFAYVESPLLNGMTVELIQMPSV